MQLHVDSSAEQQTYRIEEVKGTTDGRKGRVYRSSQSKTRLNTAAVCGTLGVSRDFFRKCAKAAGLKSKTMTYMVGRHPLREAGWLKAEAEAALFKRFPIIVQGGSIRIKQRGKVIDVELAAGKWLDRETFQQDGSDDQHFTEVKIGATFPDSTQTVRRAKTHSVRLLGKKIDWLRVRRPFGVKKQVLVYSGKQATEMNEAAKKSWPDRTRQRPEYKAQTPGHSTGEQLKSRHRGLSDQFLSYWSTRESRLRDDGSMALRRAKENCAIAGPGGTSWLYVYCDEDATNILAGKESESPGRGRPKNAELRPQVMRRKDKAWLQELIFTNGPMHTTVILERAKTAGINKHRLRRAARALRVQRRRHPNGGAWWWLLRQNPPAVVPRVGPVLQKLVRILKARGAMNSRAIRKALSHRSQEATHQVLGRGKKSGLIIEGPEGTFCAAQNGNGAGRHTSALAPTSNPDVSPSAGATRGRPTSNADLLEFAKEMRERTPGVQRKEILAAWKLKKPNHRIFSNTNPGVAFRVAEHRA
jgi:hypothetical protein